MADFAELRAELRQARATLDAARDDLAAARERQARFTAQLSALERVFTVGDEQHEAARIRLRELVAEAERDTERRRAVHEQAVARERGTRAGFAGFTDPRTGIAELNDSVPILLMPVRLETRFKDLTDEATGARTHELWVRVYPDDCWIDSFDPVLTESEVVDGRAYWTAVWEAGRIEDQERGAWRSLADAHGSGRAGWIVAQFEPVPGSVKPVKSRPEDVILTIPADEPLASPDEEVAVTAYWRAVWLADGKAGPTQAARQALETAVGAARAGVIARVYRPANFATPLPPGVDKDDVNVDVAVVVFPEVETKRHAWARAPTLRFLPDRFVFLGYRAGRPPLVVLGEPLPPSLFAGPDPSAPEAEQLRHDENGNLIVPEPLRWMIDFPAAVAAGMGFRIRLTPEQARDGFDRVLVIGLRLSADETAAKHELETLLRHHARSRKGLAIVPQGTPTNNTEAVSSGHARLDDPDDSFDDRRAPLFAPASGWLDKRDGQWLAEYLGVDPGLFAHVHGAGGTDQLTERAMNIALWPATLGYWMETMMAPVFSRDAIESTRLFFNRHVIGAGAVPAIRIGRQPYGILPATPLSRLRWFRSGLFAAGLADDPIARLLRNLYPLLIAIARDLRAQALPGVSFTGKQGDPHKLLLDIVGLHPGSVEWSQRYAESVDTLFNRVNLEGFGAALAVKFLAMRDRKRALDLLRRLGYQGAAEPPILELLFNGTHNALSGGVVDDQPLSEEQLVRAYTETGENYIRWLIDAAGTSLDALYAQDGFRDDKPPIAVLYLLLRHALQLGYHDVGVRLYEDAGLYDAERAAAARADDPFLHIRSATSVSESKYQPLYAQETAITGSPSQTVAQFIVAQLGALGLAFHVRDQLAALERLETRPTGQLERAFSDHADACSYRLDAWLLGIVGYQLSLMRNLRDGGDGQPRRGIHLGAFAWLDELRPERKVLTPVELEDPALAADFDDKTPLLRDSTNQGYVHAPSLNHAVAAAVLRNGFSADATPRNDKTMAVNLTSERVRTALGLIQGIRAGQGLGELLGYIFERGMHDRHPIAEVDQFILELRAAFPLRADRMKSTQSPEGTSIGAIEARNVIDGLALVEHIRTSGKTSYPFGRSGLPENLTADERTAINEAVEELREAHDALADVALSEGVFQTVLGNYDRVASTYEAYARGNFPPEPEIVRTPLPGIGLTHRFALHLPAGTDPTASPLPGVPMTPRAVAEPAINRWLAGVLPPFDQVACIVTFRPGAGAAPLTREVTLRRLQVQPADVLAILQHEPQAMTELDDRIVRATIADFAPRPDGPIEIRYTETLTAPFSIFEITPLVAALRRLTTLSRPLRPTDLALMNEAASGEDSEPSVDAQRLVDVRTAMQGVRNDLHTFRVGLDALLADPVAHRPAITARMDADVGQMQALLARAALFAVPQAGWGFAVDAQRRVFAGILAAVGELVGRWDQRLVDFDARIAEHDGLALDASDAERFRVLGHAELLISTVPTDPLPATPSAFRTDLITVKRPAFQAKRDEFHAIAATTRTQVAPLLADVAALLPIAELDVTEPALDGGVDAIIGFARDAASVTAAVIDELDRRLAGSGKALAAAAAAAEATARVEALGRAARTLLGDDFRLIPEFDLPRATGDEIALALAASRSGDLFAHLTNPPADSTIPALDFPVDTWLYGVARVRPTVRDWERVLMLTGGFGVAEPELEALQLPFMPGDRWIALEFAPGQKLDADRLLYAAHFATAFDKTSPQCGLLLDEWTETIPGDTAETGLTFHHDRPNAEAPQTMLLVTPSEFTGAWRWDDLVDALHETLELAKLRAVEPAQVDALPYAAFLPATVMATQVRQLTIAVDLALNNKVFVGST